jgi:hypothetical protein
MQRGAAIRSRDVLHLSAQHVATDDPTRECAHHFILAIYFRAGL